MAALERSSTERAVFLDGACGGDERLRAEVESLIAHVVPESLVEKPAVDEATQLLAKERLQTIEGAIIGPYQMLKLLGS